MRLLFFGDIVGRSGRDAALKHVPRLRALYKPDFIIVNGENAASGYGIQQRLATELFAAGVDCLTTGNHVWDQRELINQIDQMPALLRPVNYPDGTPGQGSVALTNPNGAKLLVVNVMLRLFMDALDDPFAAVDKAIAATKISGNQAIFVDMHGEATSEKMAMGHHLDGRVTAVIGTHTHVPTADLMVLPGGTAYQSDAGMTGDYDSVIGMKKEIALYRFTRRMPTEKLQPAEGEGTLSGALIDTDPATGKAVRIEALRTGGRLAEALPAA